MEYGDNNMKNFMVVIKSKRGTLLLGNYTSFLRASKEKALANSALKKGEYAYIITNNPLLVRRIKGDLS